MFSNLPVELALSLDEAFVFLGRAFERTRFWTTNSDKLGPRKDADSSESEESLERLLRGILVPDPLEERP